MSVIDPIRMFRLSVLDMAFSSFDLPLKQTVEPRARRGGQAVLVRPCVRERKKAREPGSWEI